jgi:hypothetical protein
MKKESWKGWDKVQAQLDVAQGVFGTLRILVADNRPELRS